MNPGLFPPGHVVALPDLPGRWQVWSQSDEAPGAYFFVPHDTEAREVGAKFVVAKVISRRYQAQPDITVIRLDGVHR